MLEVNRKDINPVLKETDQERWHEALQGWREGCAERWGRGTSLGNQREPLAQVALKMALKLQRSRAEK